MREYQEALQFAVEKKYPDSLAKLKDAIRVVESSTGSSTTAYHLFIFQRIASIQQLLGEGREVEATF